MTADNTADEIAAPKALRYWLLLAALIVFFLLANLPGILKFNAQEPDDFLRLVQVRDWLNGQNWFDSTQYRFDPPTGADIHWVRLVDLPIAGFMLLFGLFLDGRAMEAAAMTAVPLFQLVVATLILRALMRHLGATRTETLIAIAIIPLMPLLITNFMPMRIDHHGWQAIAALTMVWMLLRGGYRASLVGGVVAALLLWMSLEGMPMVALVGAGYAWRYWRDGARGYEGYLLGLGLAGPLLFLALRPVSDMAAAYCDMMSWPHFLAFGGAALVALASRVLPGQGNRTGRLLALLPLPLVAAPAMIVPLGLCAVSPMAELDPVLQENWSRYLLESTPIWYQHASVVGMLVATVVLLVLGLRLAMTRFEGDRREDWIALGLTALAYAGISLLMMRAGIITQLLLLPFSAIVIARLLPRARAIASLLPRVIATVGCVLIATPAIASLLLKPFDGETSYTLAEHPLLAEDGFCYIDRLRRIPRAHMFASLDKGAEIIGRTDHSVVMGGYHRNEVKMLEVFAAFGGPLDEARDVILANEADYVVTCTGSPDLAAYANMGEDNLADQIFAKDVPDWLEPVPGYESTALRLYRVK